MTLSEKIRVLRQEAGLSQTQLAEQLYVSRAAIAKWENDNGTPDVENLKALSAYFGCDLDTLLDDNKPIVNSLQLVSYCGKACISCAEFTGNQCPGCKQGPASSILTYCDIARCCKRQMKEACDGCSLCHNCGMLSKKEQMPQLRLQAEQHRKDQKAQLRIRSSFYAKWIWILFCLFIPANLASFIANDAIAEKIPLLYTIGCILLIVISATEGYILYRMSGFEPLFKTAAVCVIIQVAADLLVLLITGTLHAAGWSRIWLIPGILLQLARHYHEIKGYANILRTVDNDLSEKWEFLWKLYLITNGLVVAGILLLSILKLLALLAYLIGLVGSLVVAVLLLVYKYKTVKAFRRYG